MTKEGGVTKGRLVKYCLGLITILVKSIIGVFDPVNPNQLPGNRCLFAWGGGVEGDY